MFQPGRSIPGSQTDHAESWSYISQNETTTHYHQSKVSRDPSFREHILALFVLLIMMVLFVLLLRLNYLLLREQFIIYDYQHKISSPR